MHKYLSEDVDVHLQVNARFGLCTRMITLDGHLSGERQIDKISALLDDGKYKEVKYGQLLMLELLLRKI